MAAAEERKDDPRIYLVSCLFLVCIIGGGVFLTLPVTKSTEWYPVAGLVLVAIPWAFWIVVFFYTCFNRNSGPPDDDIEYYAAKKGNHGEAAAPAIAAKAQTKATAASAESTPVDPPSGGSRNVRFGDVETHPAPARDEEEGAMASTSRASKSENRSSGSRVTPFPF
ncbi:PREDICTED: uncharacterized protein LOC104612928 [Nelumbo nucifera]|uniref:Uncharacterized protein LOC104612928 n=2 Tax=Nelumbo nucifera TaxID=4432 RepID=A0A1U8BBW5_NELNU|nr:PREDICTED: uncharacterized protein LOC104612928 [Nelumbo nucifera]DAD36440.1 TPA_asm: hypothetical protein HUJ06_007081 [Nelumbo nucifera]